MQFHSRSPAETELFARTLSLLARPGFVLFLKGDLGAGKSTFARAFIKAMAAGADDFDVPSPSFSLIQAYDNTRLPVAHVDLYRLREAGEVDELGLADLVGSHVLLIEWPRPELAALSPDVIELEFSGSGDERMIEVRAHGSWPAALQRNSEIESFLKSQGVDLSSRRFLDGDASSRRYESVSWQDRNVILMDMPQRPDGPPVKNGKPYSAIAHLAEGIASVVAINDGLRARGLGAPEIHACDLKAGFALIENLGHDVYFAMFKRGENMEVPMKAAVEVLANMAAMAWPTKLTNRDGSTYTLPTYDLDAQLIEVDLLPAWFHQHVHKAPAPAGLDESFAEEWAKVLHFTQSHSPVWTLRDFHSPNLLWLGQRQGLMRVGLIDTQDAVMGHPAYDLASTLQDARTDIAFEFADTLYEHYLSLRKSSGTYDEVEFARAYAILGAQRATKILGIFARLNMRDGKPQYLQHMPRVARYLARSLQHPVLAGVKAWYEKHLPAALEIGRK